MTRIGVLVALGLAVLAIAPARAADVVSGFVIGNGGAACSGPNNMVQGTVGQAVVGVSGGATWSLCHGFWCFGGVRVAAVDDPPPGADLPKELAFGPPAPNPSSGDVRFAVALPHEARVDLRVLDVQGRQVREIEAGRRAAGYATLRWDGRDETGAPARAGVYFARLFVEDRLVGVKRIVLRP